MNENVRNLCIEFELNLQTINTLKSNYIKITEDFKFLISNALLVSLQNEFYHLFEHCY